MNIHNIHPRAPPPSDNDLMSTLNMPFLAPVMVNLDPTFSPIGNHALLGSISVPTSTMAIMGNTVSPSIVPVSGRETTETTTKAGPPPAIPEPIPTINKADLSLYQYGRRSMPDITFIPSFTLKRRRRRTEGHIVTPEDEEHRRRMFLERNRQAALKCRLRKKQWLADLQSQVEHLDVENKQLEHQVFKLRAEVLNLRTLIIAHKECPVAKQQQQ